MKFIHTLACLLLTSALLFGQPNLILQQYATGFNRPVDIVNAGDDRLFVVEQAGKIKIIEADGTVLSDPFLSKVVNFGQNEQGLLGLAFHPDYATNGYFFINYTSGNGDGNSKVSRFSVDASDPNKADTGSEEVILTITQPAWNHNGGDLNFGPDGYLYMGFGDGGSGGDPWGNAQNTEVMLGKMLRIDVDNGLPYTIPADNPFVDDSDVLDEIWAVGMRNPWRFSFDKITGDLWIGDVGQGDDEEIDFEEAGSGGGFNYGWDCYEGNNGFQTSGCAPIGDFTFPVAAYNVSNFCNSVTGGFVYRNCEYPDLTGHYLYADYCNGYIWSVEQTSPGVFENTELFHNPQYDISTFGEDAAGNIYTARLNNGAIYKLTTDFSADNIDVTYDAGLDVLSVSNVDDFDAIQWYRDQDPVPGATATTLENVMAIGAGNYYCKLNYNLESCDLNSDTFLLTGVAVQSIPGLTSFEVHPNPVEDVLHIDIKTEGVFDLAIEILNIKGEVLHSEIKNFQKHLSTDMNLEHLADGVYFIRLNTGNGKLARKLVKQ